MGVPPKLDVYHNELWLTMWWDPSCDCVHSEWKAFATSTEFRAGLLKGLDAIKATRAISQVGDTRKVKVIIEKDQAWVRETWIPQAKRPALKRIAMVTREPGLGKTTVVEIVDQVDDELFMRRFDSVDEAFTWVARP